MFHHSGHRELGGPRDTTHLITSHKDAGFRAAESVEIHAYTPCVKGDRVEAVVDTGQGGTQTFDIIATKAGRRIEVTTARGIVEVSEVTRSGSSGAHRALHGRAD